MGSIDRVKAAAREAGLAIEIRKMPESARTADEAAAACGAVVGQIVNSLVFRQAVSGEPALLLVSRANRVDQSAMRRSSARSWSGWAPRPCARSPAWRSAE